ncbi:MAG: transposase [Deltaproteobacteria bacterium]|nr:transposase [Deltaproteobacteria bacterium]
MVTNLPLQPLNLWRFYNDRAGVELVIRQLKGDYALGRIPGHHFFANETYFHLLLLGYNLVNWFKRLCLPPQFLQRHAGDLAPSNSADACSAGSYRQPCPAQSPC